MAGFPTPPKRTGAIALASLIAFVSTGPARALDTLGVLEITGATTPPPSLRGPGETLACDSSGNPADEQADLFCADPYYSICEAGDDEVTAFETRIADSAQPLQERAMVTAAQIRSLDPNTTTAADFIPESGTDLKKFKNYAAYLTALDMSVNPSSEGADSGLETTYSFQGDITAALPGIPGLTSGQQTDIGHRVDATSLHSFNSLMIHESQGALGGLNVFTTVWGEVRNQCGNDGLRYNAYSRHTSPELVLCPGLLITARVGARQPARFGAMARARLLMAVAHEIGHQFDDKHLPEVYSSYLTCMRSRFNDVGNDSLSSNAQYGHEIVADYMAIETVASRIRRDGASRSAALTQLRAAWRPFCGTGVSEGHPSGRYRIEMLRRSPAIHALMGCSGRGTSHAQTCTLQGEATLP